MKVMVGINNLMWINQFAYANHIQFFYNLGKRLPKWQFMFCNPTRMSIDNMRNFCGEQAIEQKCDYLLFIDDDVLVPVETLARLVSHNKDVVAGVTHIRGYPFHPMAFDFSKAQKTRYGHHFVDNYFDRARRAKNGGLIRVDAVGFSCCLIKTSLLKRYRKHFEKQGQPKFPFFLTLPNMTEDVFFCQQVHQTFPKVKIWLDTKVQTEHILGVDTIGCQNLKDRKIYEVSQVPGLKDVK